jgi:microcystin-dependent protein
MKSFYFILSLFLAVVLFSTGNAQNLTTSVQGVLRDAVGHSVEDGVYSIVFKLYTVDNGGTAIWTEQQDNVAVTHGVFSVELGGVTSLPNIDAGQVYYLGISAQGGSEMQPRIKLHNAFAANVTAAMAGFTNNIPSSGLSTLDSIKFRTDNSVMTTANPNKIGVPVGGIIMWSGSSASIPSNWKVCDGSNGTPDLRGRFIVGYNSADADYSSVGNTGGLKSVTLTTAQIPSHTHTGTTSTNGSHTHRWNTGLEGDDSGGGGSYAEYTRIPGFRDDAMAAAGDHNHTFTTNATGGDGAHENRPPYYTLFFIMKISN